MSDPSFKIDATTVKKNQIDNILEEWRDKEENREWVYDLAMDSSMKWRIESLGKQQYIDHWTTQVRKIMHEERKMTEEIEKFLKQVNLVGSYGQRLLNFQKEAKSQYDQIICFYEENSNVLNKLWVDSWINENYLLWKMYLANIAFFLHSFLTHLHTHMHFFMSNSFIHV